MLRRSSHEETAPELDHAISSLIAENYRPFSAGAAGSSQDHREPLPRGPPDREQGPPWAAPEFRTR
eukprot:9951251-Heterocapsa_arctica.AAC.1